MGTKYSTETITGYNASPPADDGSAVDSNKVKWSTIISKLSGPIKTLIENINTKLVNFVNIGPSAKTLAYTTTITDHLSTIECDGTFTVTLLDLSTAGAGYTVTIKNAGSGTITVDGTSAETIDGDASITLAQYEYVTVQVNSAATEYMKVNTSSLYADSVLTANIADSAVTTAKIASGAVTTAKIGTGAVTAGKIAASSITSGKFDFTFTTTGTWVIADTDNYVPAEGLYNFSCTSSIRAEINTGTWSTGDSASKCGCFVTDGTSFRFRNTSGGSVTVYYMKWD